MDNIFINIRTYNCLVVKNYCNANLQTSPKAGIKLQQKVYKAGNLEKVTDYIANFVYENGSLKFILTDDGRIVPKEEGGFDYEYFITDHLGNTRVSVLDSAYTGVAIVQQADNYYPFGLIMKGLSYTAPTLINSETQNKYLYNGKELQEDFGLDWYDYGARFYDAQVPHFLSVDPLAEMRYSVSPYNYVQNNPINRIDPDGMLDDEFEKVVKEDGTSTTTKVSNLGGDKVDFTHIKGGEHNGQTEIKSRGTGKAVYMKSSKNISGFTKRASNVNWNIIYEEFLEGTGPENSLITSTGMLQEIMKSPQFTEAFKEYLDVGAPDKMGYKPSFGITGAVKAGKNMTAQMIGKAAYSFYNVGDNLVITIMDSKSQVSYRTDIWAKILPESWVNDNRSDYPNKIVPQSTTRQTYLMIFPIKK